MVRYSAFATRLTRTSVDEYGLQYPMIWLKAHDLVPQVVS